MSYFAFGVMLLLMFMAMYTLGWFTGTLWERIRWNRLIEKGIIPKPDRSVENELYSKKRKDI